MTPQEKFKTGDLVRLDRDGGVWVVRVVYKQNRTGWLVRVHSQANPIIIRTEHAGKVSKVN